MLHANDEPNIPARRLSSVAPTRRRRLVKRLWQTAERQVEEIDRRLQALRDDPQSLEREAKTLALVARTVRDLVALDSEAAMVPRIEEQHDARANPAVMDANAFRRELALKLDQLRGDGAGPGLAGEPQPARA